MRLLNGIGLGTFPFASPFTPVDEETARAIVQAYLDMGGHYIDTAPTYAIGNVESLLGRVLHGYPRDRYFINTSCGYVLDNATNTFKVSGRYQDVLDDCEGSLRRLGLEFIDLYISHIPDLNTPFSETIRALEDLRKRGKIRNIGVSNVTLDQLREYNRSGAISYVQNRFSLLNQNFSPEFVRYCQDNSIGIVAYQVIERGLLTDKAPAGITLRDGDLRTSKPEFAAPVVQTIGDWVATYLKPIAANAETTVSALAIWWTLQQPGIALCQCGATRPEYVANNIAAITLSPPSGTLERINEAYQALVSRISAEHGGKSVREFMGLAQYNIYSGSASGKVNKS